MLPLIEKAFKQVRFPSGESLTESYDEESLEEANAFRGKRWQDLDPEFLYTYQDALFWFTPEALHYYLPAFLCAAVQIHDAEVLYVSKILCLLKPTGNEVLAKYRRERLQLLTDAQLDALEIWLQWLLSQSVPGGVFEEDVNDALQIVRVRAWRNW